MKRLLIWLLVLAALAIGAWVLLRDGGVVEQVTEERVEEALLANRVPAPLAGCMAPKLVDRLSIAQLIKLERMAPQEGESRLPTSTDEALDRLRRVEDDEAVEQLVRTGTSCTVELLIEAI